MRLFYLAAPFIDENPDRMRSRLEAINEKAADLIAQGQLVFSPITHGRPLLGKRGVDRTVLLKHGIETLKRCDVVLVFKLPGWEKSLGVEAEIKAAETFGIPIEFIV